MTAVEGIFKTPFRNWLVSENYHWSEGSYALGQNDREVAVIREYLQGDISEVRLIARRANEAVSVFQMLDNAARDVCDMLTEMQGLADKAANDYCTTDAEATALNERFKDLARGVNKLIERTELVSRTESDHNRLMAGGHSMTERIGDERYVRLFGTNLKLDPDAFDLTKDAKSALANISNSVEQANEYRLYLTGQRRLLDDAMGSIEEQMAAAVGIKPSDYQTVMTEQFISQLRASFSDDADKLARVQAHITPNMARVLLLRGRE